MIHQVLTPGRVFTLEVFKPRTLMARCKRSLCSLLLGSCWEMCYPNRNPNCCVEWDYHRNGIPNGIPIGLSMFLLYYICIRSTSLSTMFNVPWKIPIGQLQKCYHISLELWEALQVNSNGPGLSLGYCNWLIYFQKILALFFWYIKVENRTF